MERKFTDDAARWTAISTRDRDADGVFFYGVKSTGVYCRPACSSRLPRQENAEFFDSTEQAEQAGYRACKRCRPNALHPRAELVRRMCAYLDTRLDERVSLDMLAAEVALSPFHVQRLFKEALGLTPRQYQEAQRVARFKQSLQVGASVTDAVYEAGFSSSSRLYEAARQQLGMQPKTYRHKGAGLQISFAFIESSLGKILVAATAQGLCSVALGDTEEQLEQALRTEFLHAQVQLDRDGLQRYVEHIQAYLQGAAAPLDLPLDIRTTAFRRRVWELLRDIPYGETRSYSEIARQMGKPDAVRAVASACANNPVALVIPCHRVLQKGGALAGYRWGLPRKAALLASERKKIGEGK